MDSLSVMLHLDIRIMNWLNIQYSFMRLRCFPIMFCKTLQTVIWIYLMIYDFKKDNDLHQNGHFTT